MGSKTDTSLSDRGGTKSAATLNAATRGFGLAAMALALVCTPACSRAGQQTQGVSASHSWESEIYGLFKDNPDVASLALPRGRGAAKVCATPDVLMSLYPGRGVYAVTNDNPFARLREPSDVCSVRITWHPSNGRDIFVRPNCRIRAAANGIIEIVVPEDINVSQLNVSQFEGSDEEFIASECFYRLALVLEGYTGGLTTASFGSHPNSAYFIGRREFIGPVVAPIIQEIVNRCPSVHSHYYSHSLEDIVTGECLARIREVHHAR